MQFMEGMIGMTIPETPQEELTVQQRAEDMVFEAFDMPPDLAKQQVEEALKLDPDCISAYEVLAALEGSVEGAIVCQRNLLWIQTSICTDRRRSGFLCVSRQEQYGMLFREC